MENKINVVVADDEELFRVGIVHILSRDDKINVVYQASNGAELIDFLEVCDVLPDIVLTDIKMPKINGVEATKIILEEYEDIRVVALTTYNSKPFIRNMIKVGASAYLVKNSPPSEVLNTIKEVYLKGFHYDKETISIINSAASKKMSESNRTFFDDNFLTTREKEVLEMICMQYNTPEISEKLVISKRTVEVHRKNLLHKTESKNVAGLVIFALNHGLVPPLILQ